MSNSNYRMLFTFNHCIDHPSHFVPTYFSKLDPENWIFPSLLFILTMNNYLFYCYSFMIIAVIFPYKIWEKKNWLSEMNQVCEITMETHDVITIWWCNHNNWWCHAHILYSIGVILEKCLFLTEILCLKFAIRNIQILM